MMCVWLGFGHVNLTVCVQVLSVQSDGPTVCVGPEVCYLRDSALNAPQRLFVTFVVANIHSAPNYCMGLRLSWDVRKIELLSSSGLGSGIMLSVSHSGLNRKMLPELNSKVWRHCRLEQLILCLQTLMDNLSSYLNIFRQISILSLNKRGYGNHSFDKLHTEDITFMLAHIRRQKTFNSSLLMTR